MKYFSVDNGLIWFSAAVVENVLLWYIARKNDPYLIDIIRVMLLFEQRVINLKKVDFSIKTIINENGILFLFFSFSLTR